MTKLNQLKPIINRLITGEKPGVSFEFFPPKSKEMEQTLWSSIDRLSNFSSNFVSVTYGAGGSTRERTHKTIKKIIENTNLTPAAHLTCVGASKLSINEVANSYWDLGVRKIVALRGDPPEQTKKYSPHPEGYINAADLVDGLKKIANFDIFVACYPEIHTESKNFEDDLDNLKKKIDSGATSAITQLFFDDEIFLRWLEKVRSAGINIPIIPGIMPITNFLSTVKFCKICGASIPSWLKSLFYSLDDDQETRKLVGAVVAAEQCRRLQAEGITDLHFYTLNRADLTYAICHILGLTQKSIIK
ncbi:MAG: 5,10-methylenetetrahydrofolate reductase [Alphaproteobacteria bacterium MarineAlpha2_Bin1]|nr:MAG: 5,10-methylenetetrahydrofolate reductase [Alphaproteobacteria bacterium MarineAlpha2_Bin1]